MDVSDYAASPGGIDIGHARNSWKSATAQSVVRANKPSTVPRPSKGERFICGPIPFDWMTAASKCGSRAEAVGLLLWYAAGLNRCDQVKLTRGLLAEFDVHPKTAKRTLSRMAGAGLITVEFHRGRSPKVTILHGGNPSSIAPIAVK